MLALCISGLEKVLTVVVALTLVGVVPVVDTDTALCAPLAAPTLAVTVNVAVLELPAGITSVVGGAGFSADVTKSVVLLGVPLVKL